MNTYLKNVFALDGNNRTAVYDYLRCLAAISVIAIHQIGLDLSLSTELQGSMLYGNLGLIQLLMYTCNIIFVMLSGALLLPYREESLGTFIKKRYTKILIPLAIYFIIYYIYMVLVGQLEKVSPWTLIVWFVTGDSQKVGASHFWLMYTMLALYIIFYFLRNLLKNYSFKLLSQFVIVGLILSTLENCLAIKVLDITHWGYLGWCIVAVIGFWITREETRKYDNLLIALGAISVIATSVAYQFTPDAQFLIGNLTPLRFLVGMGTFALFLKFQDKLKGFWFIRFVSKYSFGIMLIHYICILFLRNHNFYFSSVMYKGVGCVICVAVVLLLSLIVAVIIENTVVALLNWAIKKAL